MTPAGAHIMEFDVSNCVPHDWSPDQSRIACVQVGDYTWSAIEVIRSDDKVGTIFLTDDMDLPGEINDMPSLSPDGRWLLWEISSRYADVRQLWIARADGSGAPAPLWSGDDFFDADWQPSPPLRFADIAASPFRLDSNWLADSGITTGCGTMRFCPTASVTREQMASFLVRGLGLPPTTIDPFTDDEGSSHEADINRLAAAGITKGCTATTFCPTATVSREQMAAFLHRALP